MPNHHFVEITLIGTGGGYGESIVIHLADNHWIVIDSCVDPISKTCLPLEYLKDRGVNLSRDVKLIICTHWHDDHILGIDELYDVCLDADFCFAPCHDIQKFLFFVGLDYKKIDKGVSNSSTTAFMECVDLARKRGKNVKRATQDKMLYKQGENEIHALSPSDYTLEKYDSEISNLITEYGLPDKRVVISTPNAKSVALYVKFGHHRAILGGDLEVSEDVREGWINIIEQCTKTVIDKEASLFKVPHHGSENGYHTRIWSTLLTDSPNANLTPWNRNEKLPQLGMLERMQQHTDKLYITSNVIGQKPKQREKSMGKFINQVNPTLREVKFRYGLIRCTIDGNNPNDQWETHIEGSAMHTNQAIREIKSMSF